LNNLVQRTISGVVFLLIIIGSMLLGKYTFGVTFLIILFLALSEFYDLMFASGAIPFAIPGIISGIFVFIIAFLVSSGIACHTLLFLFLPLIILLIIIALYSFKENAIQNMAITLFGIFYISFPLSAMNYLVFPAINGYEYTHKIALGILILVWINDTGAYLIGMSIGRKSLFPRISPKKSWEGTIGGAVLTFLTSLEIKPLMGILTHIDWFVIAIIVSVFGIYGDLTESLIKRSANLKDSGKIMPGHGGILDRIDSILFVIPISLVYLVLNNV
jgi:phosphatidate cytidylyltransferase